MTIGFDKLRIKHLSLAQQIRISRRLENAKRKYNKAVTKAHQGMLLAHNPTDPAAHKSLFEGKGIRKYEYFPRRGYNEENREQLHHYHVNVLRPMARTTHLALGYLKGMPYRAMEQTAYECPDWKQVWKAILQAGIPDEMLDRQQFVEWADEPLIQYATPTNRASIDYTVWSKKPVSWHIANRLKW